MRYWVGGLPIAPDVQTNNPAMPRYWVGGVPIGRLTFTPPPPPPPGSGVLPTGLTRARQDAEEWFPDAARRFQFIPAVLAPYERPKMPDFAEEWFPQQRPRRFSPSAVITVTDDFIVQFIM